MTSDSDYPGARSELEWIERYTDSALRKPQVATDTVLSSLFLADAGHRPALIQLIVQELVESARRLNAVWLALATRTRPVGRTLLEPLPGADDWEAFATAVQGVPAHDIVRTLALDDSALQTAGELAETPDLDWYARLIRCYEGGPPAWLTIASTPDRTTLLAVGPARDGGEVLLPLELSEDDAVALADATGDFAGFARDLLGTHLAMQQERIARAERP